MDWCQVEDIQCGHLILPLKAADGLNGGTRLSPLEGASAVPHYIAKPQILRFAQGDMLLGRKFDPPTSGAPCALRYGAPIYAKDEEAPRIARRESVQPHMLIACKPLLPTA